VRHRAPILILVLVVFAGLAMTRRAAAQCDFACQLVGPFCEQCLYTPGAHADCADNGVCHCWDVQCYDSHTPEQALRRETGIRSPRPEVAFCAASAEPADPLRALFAPARS
jgi:hypothetical protein